MLLVILEVFTSILTIWIAILWIRNPSGNYEPWTVICGAIFAGIEISRQVRTRSNDETKQESRPEELIHWIQNQGVEKPLSQVLPRALQLSKLLNLNDLEHWVRMELFGYNQEGGMTEQDVVPEYREITGRYINNYNQMVQMPPELHFVNGYRFPTGYDSLRNWLTEKKCRTLEMKNASKYCFMN